ncbi:MULTISPECIES: 2-oxo-tetronate isomerase [Providencia]|uniref:2-oxo-tetronate isomerase n=1 Tax=Providencia TaxID=586 RepID=UPI001982620A|nr:MULTISPECIES: 2-oxo-tetronate isomerase [Providencia]HEC8329142.1 hydroxypyruvate isomerase family protein [Providencia rettgeri]MBN4866831.1 hydroxypyruvate isomerase family protein [Providencia stuartii]MBN4876265.1 hydroxypyruvate isomerase family protein [Providencia stuartii]MBN4880845.1 hydroxypyruvate isomerase family protein [Providencia stuartii]MBN4885353.1 hydroxypyruvate isomerase family protein [Providencia stuartii]
MAKFAANLSMMFNEVPFMQRFESAANAGFKGVEYLFPYEEDANLIANELKKHNLTQALFNMPAGNWAAGERGMASLPGREAEFAEGVQTALTYAKALGCKQVHAMAGKVNENVTLEQQKACFIKNIQHAADVMAEHGIRVLIEPINTRDMPGYFLTTQKQAEALLPEINRENVFIQLDLYHCQIMEGDLLKTIERLWGKFSHIQIASVPYRHEPDSGEVNYPWIFKQLDEMGYDGWLGCEYHPAGRTEDGLGWLKQADS